MKKVLFSFALIVFICAFISCSPQTGINNSTNSDSINMDSDYSIEKHLVGSWENKTNTCSLVFDDEDMSTTWQINGYAYSGTYRVSGRTIICETRSKATAPSLFVHELSSTTLKISGVGYTPISVQTIILTKK